jgi:hypothetical protein
MKEIIKGSILKRLLLFSIILFGSNYLYSQYNWYPYGDLKEARNLPEVHALNSNEIIIFGGFNSKLNGLLSSEIFNINSGEIVIGPNMNFTHALGSSCMNKDSVIVVSGGFTQLWGNCNEFVEKYDRINKKWDIVGTMLNARSQHASIFIDDSLLLIAGGEIGLVSLNLAEIFNINSGKSVRINNLPYSMNVPKLERLSNGEIILFSGRSGRTNSSRTNNIYKFEITNKSWEVYDNLNFPVANIATIKTLKGKIVAIGGVQSEEPLNIRKEVYNENDSNKMKQRNVINFQRNWCSLGNLNDSIVIISGGFDNYTSIISECEVLNLNNYSISIGPKNYYSRRNHKSITMPGKKHPRLFIIGGSKGMDEALTSIEEIVPEAVSPPRIDDIKRNCSNYIIDVSDDFPIALFLLNENETSNTIIKSIEYFDYTKARITLGLSDISKKGSFLLKVFNNYGFCKIIKDEIFSEGLSIKPAIEFKLNANASIINDTLLLTSSLANQKGSAWYINNINMYESFNLDFSFQLGNGSKSECQDNSLPGGDGFAFVIQNSGFDVCGENNGNLGYGSLENAIAFEFDTYQNNSNSINNFNDSNGNHFAIQHSFGKLTPLHNSTNSLFINTNIPKLYNNITYNISLEYIPSDKSFKIFLDSSGKNSLMIANLKNFNFEDFIHLNDNSYFIGFTASTGCAVEEHKIFNFNLCTIKNVLDISDKKSDYKTISPNPASDYIEINVGAGSKPALVNDIEIFNIFGERTTPSDLSPALSEREGVKRIDISNLVPGVYFIRIGDRFEKFVKI